eukprot:8515532-Alexandrium_andersonii.AAC.1
MSASLVGSEMCIRDSLLPDLDLFGPRPARTWTGPVQIAAIDLSTEGRSCLLYTSDAADDM